MGERVSWSVLPCHCIAFLQSVSTVRTDTNYPPVQSGGTTHCCSVQVLTKVYGNLACENKRQNKILQNTEETSNIPCLFYQLPFPDHAQCIHSWHSHLWSRKGYWWEAGQMDGLLCSSCFSKTFKHLSVLKST